MELVSAKFQQPLFVLAPLVGGKDAKTNGIRPQFLDEGFQIVFEGEVHGWQQKANGLSFSSRFSSFRVSLEEKDNGRVELLERTMETLKAGVKERQGYEEFFWSFQSTEGALYRAQTRQNGKGGRGPREENNVWFIDRECGANVDKQ